MRLNVQYTKLNTIEKVEYVKQLIAMSTQDSLNRHVTNGDGSYAELGDFIPDDSISHEELLESKLANEKLLKIVNELRPREQVIIKLRFGLEDGSPRTLEEVGKIFNITRERVRQLECHALRVLHSKLIKKGIKSINDL